MLVPTIRFPDFTGEYEERPLSDFLSENKEKNRQNLYTKEDVKSVSGDFGVVNQIEFFGKSMAGADVSNYHVVHHNNIVYTKSPLKANPYGIIKCNTGTDGIVSTLYAVYYCDDDVVPEYVDYYFGYDKRVNKYLLPLVNIGAKHDMKVNNQDAISGSVFFPSVDEQKRVVEALKAYDERIKNQRSVIKALETRRKGLLQQIFSQEIRFKADDGSEFPDWEDTMLSDILTERKLKSTGNEEVYSVSVAKGLVNQIEHLGRSFAAEDTSKYKVVKPGDVVYTKSPTGDFKWGIVKQSMIDKDVIVSPLYGIFVPKSYAFGFVLDAYFSSSVRAHNYLITQIRKGAKNTINITNDVFLEKEIFLPTSEEEARKIQAFVELLDKQIQIEKDKLEAIKLVKKGLLQQMFV